jgi:hypothetical protein
MDSRITLVFATIFGIGFLISGATRAFGFETVISDFACHLEGFNRPLRQTIIVIDEAAIDQFVAGKASEANRRVNRSVLAIAGVLEGQVTNAIEPRERITILFARENGNDLVRAFTGCTPTYSPEEISRMEKSNSSIQGSVMKFIGRDVRSQIDKDKLSFQTSILQGMTELAKGRGPKKQSVQGSEDIGFLQTFSFVQGAFDISEGLPRLIVISPLDMPLIKNISDAKTGREKGFNLASKMGTDFQRAEAYLTGISKDASRFGRDFANAFFLGMKARLVAASGESLPPFSEAPKAIRVYGGFIDYVGVKVPMQLRLATDSTGSLVNSWVEVSVVRAVATPLDGKAVCKAEITDQCDIKGDGREFGQSWVVDVKQTPTFDPKLPFSGVRQFEFSTTAAGLKGRVFDTNVTINGKKDMSFELAVTPNIRF